MNPWMLLGGLVVWIVCVGSAYVEGGRNQLARDEAAAKVQLDAAVKQAEANWQTNYEAALELEQEKQRNVRARDRKTAATSAALAADANARSCGLGDAAFRVLGNSIAASNDPYAAAGSGDDGLQPGGGAGGQQPVRAGDSAGSNGVDSIGVPTEPQGTARLGN